MTISLSARVNSPGIGEGISNLAGSVYVALTALSTWALSKILRRLSADRGLVDTHAKRLI